MEVRIGVSNTTRELVIDSNESADAISKLVAAAADGGVFSLADSKGRTVIVPGDRLAYVEVAAPGTGTVGFKV